METTWKIHVRNGKNEWIDDDWADNEEEARQQASGWTGQRGQMAWTAVIFNPSGVKVATYKRGQEAS